MIGTIIIFLLIFFVIVMGHEFGHFLIAKVNGIRVNEFAIGMGPKIAGFKKGETEYALRAFPLGGACIFEGEDGLEAAKEEASAAGTPADKPDGALCRMCRWMWIAEISRTRRYGAGLPLFLPDRCLTFYWHLFSQLWLRVTPVQICRCLAV